MDSTTPVQAPISPSGALNGQDWQLIAKGAIWVVAGPLLTYAIQILPSINFGKYSPVIAIVVSLLTMISHQYFSGPKS